MLLNLGLSTLEGILTPLTDNFKVLKRHKTKLKVFSCIMGFLIGMLFTQCCGNYFVMMFDDYSATLPLIIVVVFECFIVSWVYAADRFLDDIEKMLRWRPTVVYKYLWKYVCLLAMLGLLGASLMRMCFKRPSYTAWNRETASEVSLEYPDWALAVLAVLIIFTTLPVPLGYIHSTLRNRTRHNPLGSGTDTRGVYTKCSTVECDTPVAALLDEHLERNGIPKDSPSPFAEENLRLLPQREGVEVIEDSTGV
ncbi:unnamed protein product [Coregonus sp. 'balchen']|nr:unnamed protein product [Coregonus sp. 'balchen']